MLFQATNHNFFMNNSTVSSIGKLTPPLLQWKIDRVSQLATEKTINNRQKFMNFCEIFKNHAIFIFHATSHQIHAIFMFSMFFLLLDTLITICDPDREKGDKVGKVRCFHNFAALHYSQHNLHRGARTFPTLSPFSQSGSHMEKLWKHCNFLPNICAG